jgi:hypothetical protein
MRLSAISFGCTDPGPLAKFWADLLGGEVVVDSEEIVVVTLEQVLLTAMRVDNYVPPTWPTGSVPK